MAPLLKSLLWIGSSRHDIRELPGDVQDVFGRAFLDAQYGDHPAATQRADKRRIDLRFGFALDDYSRDYPLTR